MPHDLRALLAPESIALVGVSPDVDIIRGRLLESVLHSDFPGALHLVSRSHREIAGRACVGDVTELPHGVDLAIVTIPAEHVVDTMRALAARAVRAVLIISSGFAEDTGELGAAWQAEIARIARGHDMVLVGPNAEGFLNAFTPLIATFSPVLRRYPPPLLPDGVPARAVAVTSQSGGMGFAFFDRGRARELPFGYVISMGNEAGAESLELMAHMLEDERIGVGLMFVEGFKTPMMLEPVATRAMRAGKPLVVAKMGRSQQGALAAAAHTSSMAGAYRAYEAMLRHHGALIADDLDDAVDFTMACAFLSERLPRGNRVAVLTPSGGAGIWLTDACADAGLEVPALDDATRARFDALLPSYGSSRNPVDLTAQFILNRGYAEGIEIVADDPGIDAVLVASSLTRTSAVEHEYDRLRSLVGSLDKPVAFWSYTRPHPRCSELLACAGIPLFTSLRGAARAMAALARYAANRERDRERRGAPPVSARPHAEALADEHGNGVLVEHQVAPLLADYGIEVAGRLATTREQAIAHAASLAGPVAIKVQSCDVAHKSDAGALRLDVQGEDAVGTAFDAVCEAARASRPDARIDGVLVQPMAGKGVEMILGIHRDPGFGPMMLLGAGGVLVEVLGDSVLAPLPVDAHDAHAMLDALRSRRLLDGVRGAPACDVEALVELMLALSRFARDHAASIEALDLNPAIVHATGVSVVDALLYLKRRDA